MIEYIEHIKNVKSVAGDKIIILLYDIYITKYHLEE